MNPTNPTRPTWWHEGCESRVLVCQYGYHPEHPKLVHFPTAATEFSVHCTSSGRAVFLGLLHPVHGDFGTFWRGDFTALTEPGNYYISIGNERSPGTFRIGEGIWDNLQKCVAWYYFGLRRMGEDNVMGNLGDYRLVGWEGARIASKDGDRYKYLGTSWADGDDGRIYPSASLVVAQYCALKETNPAWDRSDWIYSQVRWGLDGALSFLEKNGRPKYLLESFPEHQDKTFDNRFFSGDEKFLCDCFDERRSTNEYSATENHEAVFASLLLGPAYAACLFRERDPEFFARVQALVTIGYQSIRDQYQPFPQKYSLAAWIWLNVLMARLTGDDSYRKLAVAEAERLLALQQVDPAGDEDFSASGWFRRETTSTRNPWGEKPEQEVLLTPWIYQCFFALLHEYPQDVAAPRWREAIRRYASDYLLAISRRNAFGFTPMKAEKNLSSSLKRRHGDLGYQYFAKIGRHFHQVGNAAFLLQAGKLLANREIENAGWQQVFWFSGSNPLGRALIHGFGANNTSQQWFSETLGRAFPGGICNGAIGDNEDNPDYSKYNEYYTYGNLNVLWLATVIGGTRFENSLVLWPTEVPEAAHAGGSSKHPHVSFPVRMKGGFTYRFLAYSRDRDPARVRWSVNGIEGGDDDGGRITPEGVFSAPWVNQETEIKVAAENSGGGSRVETRVTILPAPGRVTNLQCRVDGQRVYLSWDPLPSNLSGYTIWRRLPVGDHAAGTIFEMVGSTGSSETGYTYPNDRIPYYDDNVPLRGLEFLVKAFHLRQDPTFSYGEDKPGGSFWAGWMDTQAQSPDRIYGFGPPSDIVRVDVSGHSLPPDNLGRHP